jgi:tyrosyl-tRNA synthetase
MGYLQAHLLWMDLERRLELISRDPTEEIVVKDELVALLKETRIPKHYIGLEISGLLHLGSLVLTGFKINDFIEAHVDTNVFLADWHTYINDKLGGDWFKISELSDYYAEAFRFFCPGVRIRTGSELYRGDTDYWKKLVQLTKHLTLSRIIRSVTIMGRSEKDNLDFSKLLYPPMQCVDIKEMDLDIVHAGMDQRKVHMLAREIFPKMGWKVPVSVHHHLLPGLGEPAKIDSYKKTMENAKVLNKMSKSSPASGILIHDDERKIFDKVMKAYCPPGIVIGNPVLELIRYIIFQPFSEFVVERPAKWGGNLTYYNYDELEASFVQKKVHPADLKKATAFYINKIIGPIRRHFEGRVPKIIN